MKITVGEYMRMGGWTLTWKPVFLRRWYNSLVYFNTTSNLQDYITSFIMILAKDNHGNTRLTGSRGRTWPLEVRRERKLSMLSRLSRLSTLSKLSSVNNCQSATKLPTLSSLSRLSRLSPGRERAYASSHLHGMITDAQVVAITNS